MGKRGPGGDSSASLRGGVDAFAQAVKKQLADKQRTVRMFDIGGSGVKTALASAAALQSFLSASSPEAELSPGPLADLPELEWLEPPTLLGMAEGEDGFALWLRTTLPRLLKEVENPSVCFGVSIGGDVDHSTGTMVDWWPAGGHPRQWGSERPNPKVADLMGLPPARTFALHDGEAHLLGSSRSLVPPPNFACFALGTGVGFGITDNVGAIVDPCLPQFARSTFLNGVPLSGAQYRGTWRQWLETLEGSRREAVEEVMSQEFANMAKPWSMPWVSLVLGRRGMELAEAAHGAPPPAACTADQPGSDDAVARREAATSAFAEQWLHFLHTQFIPQFGVATRRHPAHRISFAGGLVEMNWPSFADVLLEPNTDQLQAQLPEKLLQPADTGKRGSSGRLSRAAVAKSMLQVLPPAPRGSALIGAGLYALAGMGGSAMSIWAV